eukprot:scaffold1690_cov182-Amphora_coffeaeformis.AAC.59
MQRKSSVGNVLYRHVQGKCTNGYVGNNQNGPCRATNRGQEKARSCNIVLFLFHGRALEQIEASLLVHALIA